jgi:large subunit ribosomal protein L10
MPSTKNVVCIKKLTEKIKLSNGIIFTLYHGLNVSEILELRSKLFVFESSYSVVKNSLIKIIFNSIITDNIEKYNFFTGPIAIVFVNGDILSAIKVVVDFSKKYDNLKIISGFFDEKFIDISIIEQLSTISSKKNLLKKMLFGMNFPIFSFINVLRLNIITLVIVLTALINIKNNFKQE